MRKFWGLSLFGLFIFCANNAFAAVGVDDGGQSPYVCSELSCSGFVTTDDTSVTGGQNCAASESLCYGSKPPSGVVGYNYKTTSCTSCPNGYVMDTVTQTSTNARDCVVTYQTCLKQNICPSECPSQTEWTSISTEMEAKCLIQSGEALCMERCKEGYYQTWKRWEQKPGSLRCKKCPENAVPCTADLDGNRLKCEQNYYRVDNAPSTSSYVNMECIRCPYYAAVPTVTAGTGATSVNQCYVPNTQHMRDGVGNEFRFKSNCYYTGDYDPDGNNPVSTQPKPID